MVDVWPIRLTEPSMKLNKVIKPPTKAGLSAWNYCSMYNCSSQSKCWVLRAFANFLISWSVMEHGRKTPKMWWSWCGIEKLWCVVWSQASGFHMIRNVLILKAIIGQYYLICFDVIRLDFVASHQYVSNFVQYVGWAYCKFAKDYCMYQSYRQITLLAY